MNDPFVIGCSLIPQMTPRRMLALRARYGSYERIWHDATAAVITGITGNAGFARAFIETRSSTTLEHAVSACAAAGVDVYGIDDPEYPELLEGIDDPPPWLYVRGTIPARMLVAVVGTRAMDPYLARAATSVTQQLVRAGIVTVSGLALGIDARVHEVTLAEGGTTIAVLGSGLLRIAPRMHTRLADTIVARGGALVSEYPLHRDPRSFHYPQRNRIISGISVATTVIGAGQRSGALITAQFALDQGREVFAVPGSMFHETSRGCHALIRQGATLLDAPERIVEDLHLVQQPRRVVLPILTAQQQTIMTALARETIHIEELSRITEIAIPGLASELTVLETMGLVESSIGMRYTAIQ